MNSQRPARLMNRLVTDPGERLEEYRAIGGYAALETVRGMAPAHVIEILKETGLRGRGGAGFPVWRKWQSVLEFSSKIGQGSAVVCNAAEGEPGSMKDRYLLEKRPHLVLEGLLIAAYVLNAREIVIGVNNQFTHALASIRGAYSQAVRAGIVYDVGLRVVDVPDQYVTGEETALLECLEGNSPKPRFKPPLPVEHGLEGRPTLVHNAETIANIPLVFHPDRGGLGRHQENGTVLITLEGRVDRPGLYEAPLGTPLNKVVEEFGGLNAAVGGWTAARVGGYFGSYVRPEVFATPLDYDAMKEIGASLGCGMITVFGAEDCLVKDLENITGFFAKESCGQCGPCVNGTRAMHELVKAIRTGQATQDAIERLTFYSQNLKRRGACGLLDGAAIAVSSFLQKFSDELEKHTRDGVCAACVN